MLDAPLHILCVLGSLGRVVGHYSSSMYSRISPGWHCRTRQISFKVEKRIALALLVLRMERLAKVMPTSLESSVKLSPRSRRT